MTGRRLLLALLTAMSVTGVAEAQTKYYMRSRIAPLKATPSTPSKPSCGVPTPGNWVANKSPTLAAIAVLTGPPTATPELAQTWCNEQKNISSENMCLWVKDSATYIAINALPSPNWPASYGSATCQ